MTESINHNKYSNKKKKKKTLTQPETKQPFNTSEKRSKKRKEPESEKSTQEQKQTQLEPTEIHQVKMPKTQYAQKCAWCGQYLFCYEEIGTYDGDDPDYQGWMVHEFCNIHPIQK